MSEARALRVGELEQRLGEVGDGGCACLVERAHALERTGGEGHRLPGRHHRLPAGAGPGHRFVHVAGDGGEGRLGGHFAVEQFVGFFDHDNQRAGFFCQPGPA